MFRSRQTTFRGELTYQLLAEQSVQCTAQSVHKSQNTPGPKVTWVGANANKGERKKRRNQIPTNQINFQMRGVNLILRRAGGQGGVKREISTSRCCNLTPHCYNNLFPGAVEHFSLSYNRVSTQRTSWLCKRPPRSWWKR